METVNSTKSYFDLRNKQLAEDSERSNLANREVETMCTAFEEHGIVTDLRGKCVVDLASGDQYLKGAITERGGHYHGIDIAQCDLSSEKIPLEDNSADLCISMAFIEHILDPGHFLQECSRILKEGCALWLETPNIHRTNTTFWDDPTHIHPYTPQSLRIVLEMHGFEVVTITPNYRCKTKNYYKDDTSNFWKSRIHMRLAGTSRLPVPSFFKGRCTGMFALAVRNLPY